MIDIRCSKEQLQDQKNVLSSQKMSRDFSQRAITITQSRRQSIHRKSLLWILQHSHQPSPQKVTSIIKMNKASQQKISLRLATSRARSAQPSFQRQLIRRSVKRSHSRLSIQSWNRNQFKSDQKANCCKNSLPEAQRRLPRPCSRLPALRICLAKQKILSAKLKVNLAHSSFQRVSTP